MGNLLGLHAVQGCLEDVGLNEAYRSLYVHRRRLITAF
jgi:hypothetical protein